MVPLTQNELFNTCDLDEARELVGKIFCSHKLEMISDASAMHLQHNCVNGLNLSINYIHYGATVLIEPGELENFYLIQIPLTGNAQIVNGLDKCDSNLKLGAVLNPDRFTSMTWHAGCRQILIRIYVDTFKTFVENYIGRSLSKPIVFDTAIDFSQPQMAKWRQHVVALVAAADAGELFQGEALNQQFLEQEILSKFITLQPSNISQFFTNDISRPTAIYVKKAQRFIVENASNPIILNDIATAAGVPGRTLQYGFQCALNSTPMAVLQRERLMQVRHELASGHCGRTVSSIAAKWGFFHFGRFTQYYRGTFDELPSETLRQSNNRRH